MSDRYVLHANSTARWIYKYVIDDARRYVVTKSSIHIICWIARLIISCLLLIKTIKWIQLIKEGFEFGPMELESTNLPCDVAFTSD